MCVDLVVVVVVVVGGVVLPARKLRAWQLEINTAYKAANTNRRQYMMAIDWALTLTWTCLSSTFLSGERNASWATETTETQFASLHTTYTV